MWPAALPLGSEVKRDPVAELKGDSEAEMGAEGRDGDGGNCL